MYYYFSNNPVRYIDPSGLIKWTPSGWIGGSWFVIPPYISLPVPGVSIGIDFGPIYIPIFGIHTLIEKPTPGVPWTVANFLWHYKYGEGSSVDFYSIGLLEKFKSHRDIVRAVSKFKEKVMKQIDE